MASALLAPLKVGAVNAKNRIFLAPLTRCRATMPGHVPNALMAEYYGQRATGGLLIAEATGIFAEGSAFLAEPGVYSKEQVEGWKLTTDAVHKKGGSIFLQIWHGGRACHPSNNGGAIAVAPSVATIKHSISAQHNPSGKEIPNAEPRALTDAEIPAIVDQFVAAATNAIEAGFDGVEVHAANGYLINQFLSAEANQRTEGPYAKTTIETRAKFLLDVVGKVVAAVGADRVGVRISPLNQYNGAVWVDPAADTEYVSKKLSELKIAFLHVMRADFFGPVSVDVLGIARANFSGVLVGNMGYKPEEAEEAIAGKKVDAVAFGTSFLANPDLPHRIANKLPLNAPNPATFYTPTPEGYIDYPTATA